MKAKHGTTVTPEQSRYEAYELTKLALTHDSGTEAEQVEAIEAALRAAEAMGKAQGLRDALELVRFEICGPRCGHECCSVARSLYRAIAKAADAIEQR